MGRSLVIFLLLSAVSSICLYVLVLYRTSSSVACLSDIAREILTPAAFATFEAWEIHTEPLPRGYQVVCSSDSELHVGAPTDTSLPWYIFHKPAGELQVRTIGRDGKVADGPGKSLHADGSIEDCFYVDNQCTGKGKAEDAAAGWYYEGEFFNGWRHGFGTLVSERNGTSDVVFRYAGEMRLNEIHGAGSYVGENLTYVGQFRWGQMTGFGHMTRQGRTMTGQFVDGEINGFGCEQDQWFVTCGVFIKGVRDGKAVRMDASTLTEAKYLSFKDGIETWW